MIPHPTAFLLVVLDWLFATPLSRGRGNKKETLLSRTENVMISKASEFLYQFPCVMLVGRVGR